MAARYRSHNLLIVPSRFAAEDVETQEQADYLYKDEVESVQGVLYAKTMPATIHPPQGNSHPLRLCVIW